MKIDKKHIDHIKTGFSKMKSKKDLLTILNYAKPLVYGDNVKPFTLKQLTYYSNPKRSKKAYVTFEVKKKSGANRTINAPVKGLKALQKSLCLILQCVFEPHKAATGFVMNKSIVDNAKIHVNSNYVFNVDLKDYFSSIDQARVWSCLKLKPFNLIDTELPLEKSDLITTNQGFIWSPNNNNKVYFSFKNGFISMVENKKKLIRFLDLRSNLANLLAALTCTEMEVERKNSSGQWEIVNRNVLPQGAPTSPVLSNVVCQRLDHLLTGVANRFGLRYTRYADDITFSSMHNVYQKKGEFLNELTRIILDQGFHIKESKTRLQKTGHRKEVTGLLVNEGVNVQKRYIKQLRMQLYYWEKYGYEKASSIFKQQYLSDKGNSSKKTPNMKDVIAGKLDYLKMVKGDDNPLYLKLKNRFEQQVDKLSSLENILNIWEEKGIEKAMEIYKTESL